MADDLIHAFRGPGGFMPPVSAVSETVTNAAGSDLLAGEVVRINGNLTVTRAQANIAANVTGLVGAMLDATPLGARGRVTNVGLGFVLLEPLLAPVAGQPLWVSATIPGRATNLPPALPVFVGTIKDASGYAATGGVVADIMPSFLITTSAIGTLAQTYATGINAVDQTFIITDARGGGIVINATTPPPLFTGVTAFEIDVIGGSVNFYRIGGFDVSSAISRAAAPATVWDEVALLSSTLTLTGGPAVATALAMVHVGAGVINGAGNTASDAYNFLVDASPAGTATVTRSWAAGFAGAIQGAAGLVLGTALNPPTEHDLVMGAGATVVSQANSGRLGYELAGQRFMISMNGGAYVPLLYGPAAGGFTAGSVPFGSATGTLTEDNANLFFHDANNTLQLGGAAADAMTTLAILGSKTQPAPAIGNTWNALNFQASTYTFTMGAGNVTITALSAAAFSAPTITTAGGAGIPTVTTAATVTIAGAPVAAGGAVITNPMSFVVSSGSVSIGIANTHSALEVFGSVASFMQTVHSVSSASTAFSTDWETLALINDDATANNYVTLGFACKDTGGTRRQCSQIIGLFTNHTTAHITGGLVFQTRNDNTQLESMRLAPSGNVLIGATADLAASKLNVLAAKSIASGAGAVWDGIHFDSETLTITGGPGPITSLTKFIVKGPVVTSAAANVIADFYTARIGAATFAGVGPASATRSWSFFSEGNSKFGGGMAFKGTDVNAVGPYVVLETDFYLEVRYTATGVIQINLPSIATQAKGRTIAIIDSGYNAAAFNITVAPNGADKINNVAANFVIGVSGACYWLKANTTTSNWEIV